jgi:hypothetical protein
MVKQDIRCSYCVYSSYLFATNTLAALYVQDYIYALLFCMLTITSIIHHMIQHKYTGIIDRVAVYSVMIYGGYIFYNHIMNNFDHINIFQLIKYILIISTFLSVVYLYSIGYVTERFSFDTNKDVAEISHCLLHLYGSIGHHFIIGL